MSPRDILAAKVLKSAAEAPDWPLELYGEWHHLWALCVFGSVEDIRNYKRLHPKVHLQVHAALVHFFGYIRELRWALIRLLNSQNKDEKYNSQILTEILNGGVSSEIIVVYMNIQQWN